MRARPAVAVAALVLASCGGPAPAAAPPTPAPPSTAAPPSGSTTVRAGSSETLPVPTVTAPPMAHRDLPLVYEPASPEELALTIAAAHGRIAAGDGVDLAGRDLQRALRALSRNPAWLERVDRAMAGDVRVAWASDLLIQRALQASPPPPRAERPATIPAWTIREPLPAAQLRAYYDEASALTGIGWEWLAAINLVETRMGRIVGVSSAGAEGPMQFLPSTWASCCTGNIWDDRDAIVGAATYLQQSGGPADMRAAVLQYNPNDLYLALVTAYADAMRADPQAYAGFHAYEVIVPTSAGDVRLPVGFSAAEPVDAAAHLATAPEDRASPQGG